MQNLRGSTTTRCPPCVRLPRIQRTHVSSEHDSGSRDILTGFVTRTERSEHGLWLVSGTAIFGNMDASDGLGVVPAHTYARLRFDEAAEEAIENLANVRGASGDAFGLRATDAPGLAVPRPIRGAVGTTRGCVFLRFRHPGWAAKSNPCAGSLRIKSVCDDGDAR